MSSRISSIAAVYLVATRTAGGVTRVLMSQRSGTGYRDGYWSLPAGHLEAGEAPTVSMAREALEETGLVLKPAGLAMLHMLWRRTEDSVGGRFDLYLGPGDADALQGQEPRNLEPQKCSGLEWHPVDRLPERTIPEVAHALRAIGQGLVYSEHP